MCAAAATIPGDTAGARLLAWLAEFFSFLSTKRHIASMLLNRRGVPIRFGDSRSRVVAAGASRLEAAQHGGETRRNLSIDQVLDLVHAIAMIQADAIYVEPILRAALDGPRV